MIWDFFPFFLLFLIVISPIQFFSTVQHGDPVTHTCKKESYRFRFSICQKLCSYPLKQVMPVFPSKLQVEICNMFHRDVSKKDLFKHLYLFCQMFTRLVCCMVVFMLQWKIWLVAIETVWWVKPQTFSKWPFYRKRKANSWYRKKN